MRTAHIRLPVVLLLLGVALSVSVAPSQDARRDFSIRAADFRFTPARLEVRQDDLVKISLQADDLAHSFTIDEYRIAKRAAAGQTITFEFRADRSGTFRFYCNLTIDDRCRNMHGELVVRPH